MATGKASARSARYFTGLNLLAVIFPLLFVVLRVREDMFDEDGLPGIVDFHDQAILVPADIEHRASAVDICMGVDLLHLIQTLPARLAAGQIPAPQRPLRARVLSPERSQ